MQYYQKLIAFMAILGFFELNPAVFKIINKTATPKINQNGVSIRVQPLWNGSNEGFIELKPGDETSQYDTGINNLTGIIYEEVLPQNDENKQHAIFCVRRYKVDFNINALALGGTINIQSGADISYSFDTLGVSGIVKAQAYN